MSSVAYHPDPAIAAEIYGVAPFPPKHPMGKPPPREVVSTHSERTA